MRRVMLLTIGALLLTSCAREASQSELVTVKIPPFKSTPAVEMTFDVKPLLPKGEADALITPLSNAVYKSFEGCVTENTAKEAQSYLVRFKIDKAKIETTPKADVMPASDAEKLTECVLGALGGRDLESPHSSPLKITAQLKVSPGTVPQ